MQALEKLKEIFGKKGIKLVESGDHAIKSVLQFCKDNGRKKVLIQDQGGWLTYKDYAKKVGLEIILLKTDYGLIDLNDLSSKADSSSVLLVNSLNGYFSEQAMGLITDICISKKCFLINDASGSIGTLSGEIGDLIICSFGKDKPVNLHYGGCIAFDDESLEFEGEFDSEKLEKLSKELDNLYAKQMQWEEVHWKIKNDLIDFDIIHRDKTGINVIVKFSSEEEKEKIIKYCDSKKYEYTICPRYIRVNCNAISIEVKRIQNL